MKFPRLAYLVATLAAFSGSALAQIPGLFVVQEARIDDPTPGAVSVRSSFGRGGISSIGDFDGDGVDDLISGAYSTNSDTGSLVISLINKAGALKSPQFIIAANSSPLKEKLRPGGKDQFGYGIAVIRKFSKTQSCAK